MVDPTVAAVRVLQRQMLPLRDGPLMGSRRITPRQREILRQHIKEGYPLTQAAKAAGMSYSAAQDYRRKLDAIDGKDWRAVPAEEKIPGPVPFDELCAEARRALTDFAYFRQRYLGHTSTPWQIEAAETVVAMLNSPDKEYVVLNCPPGAGKSTLLHDIACWVTVKDRTVRGVFGSATFENAKRDMGRVKRTLERVRPAGGAEATLAQDYGLLRPPRGDEVWRADYFTVAQMDEGDIEDKEPTWSAVGQDTEFLGNRYDIILWDDLATPKRQRSMEMIEQQREWWDGQAESRLEPGGCMFLVGQRVGSQDIYRWNLDKTVMLDPDDDEDTENKSEDGDLRVYKHIVYRAHDPARCEPGVTHKRNAPAWPEGCLLDPYRLPWRELRAKQATSPATFAIWYQQEDADPEQTLVKPVWVSGGEDPDTGTLHFGCWDKDRDTWELPEGITGPRYIVGSVDPSPTKWWAVQLWAIYPEANQMVLITNLRRKMGGNELLDWYQDSQTFGGVMEEWQTTAKQLGWHVDYWIVEANVAQRFLLQYDHVRRWVALHGTNIIPHQTTARKSDPDLGVDVCREWWRSGRIRLPGAKGEGRLWALKLVEEVQKWPNPFTDDQVMAHWFVISHLSEITAGWDRKAPATFQRPSFVGTGRLRVVA